MNARILGLTLLLATQLSAQQQPAKPRPYRLPGTDLKQRIIWDAQCKEPEGSGLAFGGQDQIGEDGRAGTRILANGVWAPVQVEVPKFQADAERKITAFREQIGEHRRQFFQGELRS